VPAQNLRDQCSENVSENPNPGLANQRDNPVVPSAAALCPACRSRHRSEAEVAGYQCAGHESTKSLTALSTGQDISDILHTKLADFSERTCPVPCACPENCPGTITLTTVCRTTCRVCLGEAQARRHQRYRPILYSQTALKPLPEDNHSFCGPWRGLASPKPQATKPSFERHNLAAGPSTCPALITNKP